MARRTSEAAGGGWARVMGSRQAATHGMSSAVTWLTGQVVAMGPRLKIRDQATLRVQFPGRTDEEIAGLLIEHAGRASAAVGGATGAWAALPVLPAFPAEVAAETLAVIGIELKLVAELHEALGLPAQGSGTERARAYLAAWAHRRGVFAVPGGFALAAGSPLARMLRRRLVGRVRRSAFALGPVLTGAVAGAVLNRMETRRLGREILTDLRRHQREIGPRRLRRLATRSERQRARTDAGLCPQEGGLRRLATRSERGRARIGTEHVLRKADDGGATRSERQRA
jgi:hypothetical protein